MGPIIQKMERFFDRQNLPVSVVGPKGEAIRFNRSIPGVPDDVTILLITDDEDFSSRQVQIKIYGLCQLSQNGLEVYRLLNELNSRVRWFRVSMDEENAIELSSDLIVNMNAPENEIFELMTLGMKLAESIYPEFHSYL